MTIKRNGDRVILKDGKVSCSCCAGPGCCMYPAQALADGLYSASDLPDQIVFNWAEPDGPPISTVIDRSGSQYETNVGTTNLVVRIESNPLNPSVYFWYRQVSGPLFPSADSATNPCLIWGDGGLIPQNDLIEDQFADTYTVNANLEYPWEEQGSPITIPVNGSFTLERFSLCQWRSSGFPSNAPFFVLNYVNLPPSENPILEEGPHWVLRVFFLEYDPGLFVSGREFKNGLQNSPVGSYGTGIHGTASIS